MKKLILVLLIGLLVSTATFADHDGFGIGVILGGGGGFHEGGAFYPGVSLKIPALPVFWGIYTSIGWKNIGLNITGDYYFFDKNLFSNNIDNDDGTYKFILDWYFGLGGVFSLNFWNEKYNWWGKRGWEGIGMGLRVPIGLSWHVIKQFEIAVGLAPVLGLYIGQDYWTDATYAAFWWDINAELVFRFWIKK
jgi:hypothetical protein